MEFYFDEQLEQRIDDRDLLQMEYGPQLISGSRAVLISFPGGRVLSQVLETTGFPMWFHDFFIEKPVTLFATSKEPLRVLHYALASNAILAPSRGAFYPLYEWAYYLLRVPSQTQQAFSLIRGTSRIFQIDIPVADPKGFPGKASSAILLPFGVARINKVVHCGVNDYQVQTVIRAIREQQIAAPAKRNLFLTARLLDLLRLQLDHLAIKSQSSAYAPHQKMEAIQDYILTHLEQPLTYASLCEQLHISKSVLQRYCKQYAQQSLAAYIRKQRMEYGAFLLQCGVKPMSEIPLLTGYRNISGFRRAFKAYFGFSVSHVVRFSD